MDEMNVLSKNVVLYGSFDHRKFMFLNPRFFLDWRSISSEEGRRARYFPQNTNHERGLQKQGRRQINFEGIYRKREATSRKF